jgi:hypothetical protein
MIEESVGNCRKIPWQGQIIGGGKYFLKVLVPIERNIQIKVNPGLN